MKGRGLTQAGVWLGITIVLAAVATACSGPSPDGVASRSASPVAPGASPASQDSPFPAASHPGETDVQEVAAPAFAYREFRLDGQYIIEDFDDTVSVLCHQITPAATTRIAVMANTTGALQEVVAGAASGKPGWTITTVRGSSQAIAWEELGPGDDLTQPVGWRLYAAPLNATTLQIGKTRLLATGRTDVVGRPLFDVTRNVVVWETQRGSLRHQLGEVRMAGVATGASSRVATTTEAYHSLSTISDAALVTIRHAPSTSAVTAALIDLKNRRRLYACNLANRDPIGSPAYADGWLAWSVLGNEDKNRAGALYLRDPEGAVSKVENGDAGDPVLCSGYLFFFGWTRNDTRWYREAVYGVRLATLERFTLVMASGTVEDDYDWQGLFGAPIASSHLVLGHYDKALGADVTRIRVYQVD